MSDTPAKYPDLTAELRDRSLLGALKIFGPGAIIASVTIGNGETIFASRGGAIFGYTLMWCFVLGAAIKFFQVYSGARFITLTGRHPLESWAQLPGLRGWFVPVMTVLTLICMPLFLGGGLPRILGDFTNSIFGIVITPESAEVSAMAAYESKVRFDTFARIWGSLYILVAIGLTLYQTYGFLERVQTFVVGLLLFSMFVAVVASRPDLMALVQGIFIPTIPQYEPWITETITLATRDPWVELIVYFGVIGGGTVDYFGYLGTLREKGWGLLSRTFGSRDPIHGSVDGSPNNASLGRSWLRAPLIDVSMSFAAVIAFTLFFATLGAAILHPEHVVPEASELVTKQQAFMVRESQHPSIQWLLGLLYKTGIFFAFFGTMYGGYELYSRSVYECLTAAVPKWKTVPLRVFRLWTCVVCGVIGLALLWWNLDPVAVVTPAAIISATFTCGMWCFAMLGSDRLHVPEGLRMGPFLVTGLVVSGLALTFFGVMGFYLAYFAGSAGN